MEILLGVDTGRPTYGGPNVLDENFDALTARVLVSGEKFDATFAKLL